MESSSHPSICGGFRAIQKGVIRLDLTNHLSVVVFQDRHARIKAYLEGGTTEPLVVRA